MSEALPCRSVAEAHLCLDLMGAAKQGRSQRLEDRGDDRVSVYTVTIDGEEYEVRFLSPEDPLGVEGFGGPEPSEIIDPGQWILHADRLAASVPADPGDVDPGAHAAVAQRLEEAAQSIDEVVKFIPEGEEQMPADAFWTPIGKITYFKEVGRFRRSRLEAVAGAYRDVARRFVH